MPSFVVSTAFKGKDGISSAFKNMSKNADKFGSRASKAFSRASKSASRFGTIVKGVLTANVLTRGTVLLKQGLQSVAEEFVNFDQSITSAGAKFGGIKRGTKEFEALGTAARGIGATTEFTASEAAGALDFMAMAGLNDKQSMAALKGVTDLASASNIELTRSADVATDALGAFNLMTEDSSKLTENLTRVNDVFATTLTGANLDMEQLVGTLEQSASSAKIAGVGLETYGALVKPMADKFIKGSKAGTTLKNVFLRLASPPKEAAKALKKLNIETSDKKTGKMRDMIGIFEELRVKTGKLGEAQRAQALDAIFGKRAIEGATAIMETGGEKLNQYRDDLRGAKGAASELATEMREGLTKKLLTLKSSLIEVGLKVLDAFKEKFPEALDKATKAIQDFDATPIIDGMKTAFNFTKKLVKWMDKLSPLIIGVTVGFIVYKIALAAVIAVQAVQFFFQTAIAIKAAAVSMGLLNAVFIASPIGVIAVAVGLLVAGVIWLYKNWDKVKAAFQRFYEYVEPKIRKFITILDELLENPFFLAVMAKLFPWILAAMLIVKHWDKVKILFKTLEGVHSEMVLIVADGIEFLADKFTMIKNTIVGFVNTVWKKLSKLLENPFFTFALTMIAPWLSAPALIIKHWDKLRKFFAGLLSTVGEFFGLIGSSGDALSDDVGIVGNSLFEELDQINKDYQLATGPNKIQKPVAPAPEAPNKTQVEVEQKSKWYGQLDIAGAPKGSVFEQNTTKDAPKINVKLLGENP